MNARDFLILVSICFVWALNVVLSKVAIDTLMVPPLFYTAVRAAIIAVVLAPLLLPLPRPFWRLVLVVLLIGSGSFALTFIGLRTTDPSTVAVVSLLGAPLTAGFAVLLLGERIRWRRGLGIALTFVGVAAVIWSPSGLVLSTGILFVIAAAIMGALGAVLLKKLPDIAPLRMQAWVGATGIIVVAPLSALLEADPIGHGLDAGWTFLAIVGFSALVVSIVAHTTYYSLLRRYEANVIAPLTLMTPLFTIALGVVLTHDPVDLRMIVGAAIAIAGVLIIAVRPSLNLPKMFLARPRI